MKALVLVLALLLTGCATEFSIKCKGKGALTGSAMIYGGQLQADCGEGFEYERKMVK